MIGVDWMGVKLVDVEEVRALDVLVIDVVARVVTVVEVVGEERFREKLRIIASLGSEVVDVELCVAELFDKELFVAEPSFG